MKKVYIAGAITSNNPVKFLDNLRKGMRLSTECILAGYAVFSPFIDFNLFFQCRDEEQITVKMIKTSSMKWLEVSDQIILVPEWEDSQGTLDELKRAKEIQIIADKILL